MLRALDATLPPTPQRSLCRRSFGRARLGRSAGPHVVFVLQIPEPQIPRLQRAAAPNHAHPNTRRLSPPHSPIPFGLAMRQNA